MSTFPIFHDATLQRAFRRLEDMLRVVVTNNMNMVPHALLGAEHSATVAAAPVQGDLIVANSTPKWTKLAIGAADAVLGNISGVPGWVGITTEVTGTTQQMTINSRYIANNAALVTLTLPSAASIGQYVIVYGKGAGLFKIAQNADQQIIVSSASATTVGVGGSLTVTERYEVIALQCITATTTWLLAQPAKAALTIV